MRDKKDFRTLFVITILFTILFLSETTFDAQAFNGSNVSGNWKTSEGDMKLVQSAMNVKGRYSQDNGEIEGQMFGDMLEGIWIEDHSDRRCSYAKNGRHFWGRIRLVFAGDRFTGSWGYCDDEPGRSWTGEKSSDAYNASMREPYRNIAGKWRTSEGELMLEQVQDMVRGNYSQDNGEINGRVQGNIFRGHWIEDHSDRRCSSPKNGRYYWGTVELRFEGDRFTGLWGYCDGRPDRNWTGELAGTSSSGTGYSGPNVSGRWKTTEGEMTLSQSGNSVKGRYAQDNGEIDGQMQGNVLIAYWIEDHSDRRCSSPKNGRYYWGQIRFSFEENRFSGTWGYCNDQPGRPWSGSK